MSEGRSEFEEVVRSDKELHELLQRLQSGGNNEEQLTSSEPEVYTVEDIAEATGLHPDHVAKELSEMLREAREARIVDVLRDLEEPTHRVERPSPESVESINPIFRLNSVRALMERNKLEPKLPRRKLMTQSEERQSQVLTWVVLIILAMICAALLIRGMFFGGWY